MLAIIPRTTYIVYNNDVQRVKHTDPLDFKANAPQMELSDCLKPAKRPNAKGDPRHNVEKHDALDQPA